jgi:transposase
LRDLCGVECSAGTVQACIDRASRLLTPAYESIANALKAEPVLHADETGFRVNKKLRWMHTACTPELTWYGIHDKRGRQAMDQFGILGAFKGVMVHDGLASYRQYDCRHALCNAHHLRELILVAETTGQTWPAELIHLLCQAKEEVAQNADALSSQRLACYRRSYGAILTKGEKQNPPTQRTSRRHERIKQTPAFNLLDRLRRYRDDVLRFMTNPAVPFDNNQAERDLRMAKLKQKISGCFRTASGSLSFCIIRSYLSTLYKQGINLFQALTSAFMGNAPCCWQRAE